MRPTAHGSRTAVLTLGVVVAISVACAPRRSAQRAPDGTLANDPTLVPAGRPPPPPPAPAMSPESDPENTERRFGHAENRARREQSARPEATPARVEVEVPERKSPPPAPAAVPASMRTRPSPPDAAPR